MGFETAYANGLFDPEVFKNSEYGKNAVQMQQIYFDNVKNPMSTEVIKYWEKYGVRKELFEKNDNNIEGAFSVFTPLDMDKTKNKKYPLIYCSHGGGDDIFLAETYGYTMLVGSEKVICVYPWNKGRGNEGIEEEFPKVINFLQEKGYPIDTKRIYAVGFSAGSVASLRLAMAYPKMLAGVAPVPGSNSFRGKKLASSLVTYTKKYGYFMPLICVGGTNDGGDAWPLEKDSYFNTFNDWIKNVSKVHDNFEPMSFELSQKILKDCPDSVKRKFGLNFDRTWIEFSEGTYWYCGDYLGKDNIPVARFVGVEGVPHIHCKGMAPAIWNYLKQFSRNNETGECSFNSDDINFATDS